MPAQSYALYLPSSYEGERPAPILYCFDPRSRGAFCVELFREAAERLGYIIASSNNSGSDGPIEPNLDAIDAIWVDTHARLAIDDRRTYATGFSGGGRVANLMGQGLGLAGVISVGAGFPPSAPPRAEIPFDFYALIGDRDFNYYELRALDRTLADLGLTYRIEIFDGPHRWCPEGLCGEALEWMELQAMRRGLAKRDQAFIAEMRGREISRAELLESEGRVLEAWSRYTAIERDFAPFGDVEAVSAERKRLQADPALKGQRREQARWDQRSQAYLDRLPAILETIGSSEGAPPSRDTLQRELQVQSLLARANSEKGGEQAASARRLLEMVFVQTAQAQVRPLLAAGNYSRAALALSIAVTIKPERANAWYNLGCAQAQAGRRQQALEALARAVDAGFDDLALLESDSDLATLRGEQAYIRLVERLDRSSD
jgi:dienelactone hydrolase